MRKVAIGRDNVVLNGIGSDIPYEVYVLVNDDDSLTNIKVVLEPTTFTPPQSTLTKREKQILNFLADGMSSKEIASTLFISVNTVNTHRQRIIEKLEVRNTAEAVKKINNRDRA